MKFEDGRRAQGTRELPRVLDELVPEPRLVSDDPRALEAERWADDVLQQWARRMVASTGSRDPDALAGRGAGGRLGPLLTPYERPRRVVARMVLVAFRVTKEQLRDDRERTGEILDRVDAWIADGVLNGEQLHSADFAVASSLALVEYILAASAGASAPAAVGAARAGVQRQRRSTRSSVSLRPSSVSASTRRRKRPRRWIRLRGTTPVRSVGPAP